LPLAGVVAAVVVGGAVILRRFPGISVRTRQWVAAGVILALVGALGTLTRARNRDYASAPGLWLDTMAKQPDNPYGQMGYGVELLVAGRAAEAEPYLQAAVNLDGGNARALMNLGAAELVQGKFDQAIPCLERALSLRPDFTGARRNLAEAYAARKEDARAVAEFGRLLQDLPDDAAAIHRLAWILATSADEKVRDSQRAVELAERAVELTGRRNAMFLNTLSAAYGGAGRLDEAVRAMREALAVTRTSGRAEEAAGLERQLRGLEDRQRAGQSRR